MRWHYTISDFFMLLKLGIFREANIKNLGRVRMYKNDPPFFRGKLDWNSDLSEYKQIGLGIYILNLFQLSKERNTEKVFIMRLSIPVNASGISRKTLTLKIITKASASKIKRVLTNN